MKRRRKRAHPLIALMRANRRLFFRLGIAALYLFVALLFTLILRFLIPNEIPQVKTLLLISIPALLTFYPVGAMALHEGKQHIYAAFYSAAIRGYAYVHAKAIVMTFWGTLTGCLVYWFSDAAVFMIEDGLFLWESLLAGDAYGLLVTAVVLILSGMLFSYLGVIVAAMAQTMNRFHALALLFEALFVLPAAWDLFAPLPDWGGFHPVIFLTRVLSAPAEILIWVNDPAKWVFFIVLIGMLIILFQIASAASGGMMRRKENAS